MKLSIGIISRGRPNYLSATIMNWLTTADIKEDLDFVIALDDDDKESIKTYEDLKHVIEFRSLKSREGSIKIIFLSKAASFKELDEFIENNETGCFHRICHSFKDKKDIDNWFNDELIQIREEHKKEEEKKEAEEKERQTRQTRKAKKREEQLKRRRTRREEGEQLDEVEREAEELQELDKEESRLINWL